MKLFVFFTLLFSCLALRAQNELADEVYPDGSRITLVAPFGVLPSGGFAAVRVDMENKGTNALTWNLKSTSTMRSYYRYNDRSSSKISTDFSVSCPVGETRQVELLIPVHQAQKGNGSSRDVRISGSTPTFQNHNLYGSLDDDNRDNQAVIAFSMGLRGSDLSNNLFSYRSSGLAPGEFTASQLPQDWRAYAGFDALFLTLQEWLTMTPGVSQAIDQWILSGGHLLIVNPGDESFPDKVEQMGFGSLHIVQVGSGYINLTQINKVTSEILVGGQEVVAASDYRGTDWILGQALGSRSMHSGLLLLALMVFAIIVGPINLFVWANKHRRHRLFVTTPIISLGASLLLVVIIIFQDGFGGDGARAIAIDVGEPGSTSAGVIQEQFSRTGILFSSGFEIDDQSVMVPVTAPMTDYNRADSKSSTGELSYSAQTQEDGWKIKGDWFSSRTEQAQVIRSVIPSRERLELVTSGGGSPRLVSSFANPLSDVFYRDRDGKVWTASSIDPGETVTLNPSSSADCQKTLEPLILRFGPHHQSVLGSLIRRVNSFSASAATSHSIETLSSIDWQESPTLITGLLSK